MSELNALLRRQLRRLGLSEDEPPSTPAAWRALLERLSQSYDDADRERYTTERAFSISSREMKQLYERLKLSSQNDQRGASSGRTRSARGRMSSAPPSAGG
jgi:hypothetical protein